MFLKLFHHFPYMILMLSCYIQCIFFCAQCCSRMMHLFWFNVILLLFQHEHIRYITLPTNYFSLGKSRCVISSVSNPLNASFVLCFFVCVLKYAEFRKHIYNICKCLPLPGLWLFFILLCFTQTQIVETPHQRTIHPRPGPPCVWGWSHS